MKEKKAKRVLSFYVLRIVLVCVLGFSVIGVTAYAWYSTREGVLSYAPVSSPESLYVGAGHRDIENNEFEDIRYMYFNAMDADGADYVDRVFCIFGGGIGAYKLQLAYTTNNPFEYKIYRATESKVSSEGAIKYVTHTTTPETYYYSVNGEAIEGTFLNRTTEDGKGIATTEKHTETYGSYPTTSVQKNAEPIYWQTTAAEIGNAKTDFVNYYILRVYKNGKANNDRETDILCISAKTTSV